MTMIVEYDGQHGTTVADEIAIPFLQMHLEMGTSRLTVGTTTLLAAARVLVKEEDADIIFVYLGQELPCRRPGKIDVWPPGMDCTFENLLERLCA